MMSPQEERMPRVKERVRRETDNRFLAPLVEELEDIRARSITEVRQKTDAFWEKQDGAAEPESLIAWFQPRCWREIDYVFMLGEEIRRYGFGFERKHVTALAKQLFQEAEHYESVGRIIVGLGGEVPTEPPPSARAWSAFLWDCLDRHPLSAIAAWYMSETAATGTLEGIVAGGERYRMPDVVTIYQQIIKDEAFHLGLGRLLLERYVTSPADAAEVIRSIRGMAELVSHGSHTDVLVTPVA
jgi:hypothetical protein